MASESNHSPDPPENAANSSSTATRSPSMVLSIKTLEQQTKPVTISRDASVLDLKHAVQGVFQIESNRQRLIFQGKMMKDGQNLAEYANLDTGKVVHLVVRPPGVQANPQNDEPRPQTNNRRTYSRGMPRFPFMSGGFPMMEGYTFITLDVGDRTNPLSSLMEGLTGPLSALRATRDSTTSTSATNSTSNRNRDTTPSTTAFSTTLPRPQFEHQHLGSRSSSDLGSNNTTENRSSSTTTPNTQFPASVEVRLMRTMGCMRNVRTILDTPTNQSISGIATTSSTSPEVANEIRARLRGNGNSQTAAVGLVLDELATLMTDVIPRLREMSNALRAGDRVANSEENMNLYRRVLRTARIIQGMSLIYHFLGSVLAAADISPRRTRTRTSSSTTAQPARSDTTANQQANTNTPTPSNTDTTTTTSTSIDHEGEPQQEARGVKRKNEEDHHSSADVGEGSSSSDSQEKKGKAQKESD
ncbi:hypothetical protein RO3G_09253 [Lichtheimia corymbifera JMRC:FSU:9682]|uniref:Ubiquitin-like domain-containing protein n=1 Tax=Lichtheimia corymbifera JMRC:FSU:9682 TaxID=1263082 RepID=A0A068RS24_9FUNG|nr:hypothetical protein RO3G_09253 [Lichtheimia corymbifera JMRC:FSU:9682]